MEASPEPIAESRLSGLPLFWAEGPRPFMAGIDFRVGTSDETLPQSGITHLVEHLIIPARRIRGIEFNGTVDGLFTSIWASGDRAAVFAFLAEVARSLADLPVERLEIERAILRTEAANPGSGAVPLANLLRFGPVGHGLIGYADYGLNWLGGDETRRWASERFSRENAALWMTGLPPAELELDLAAGPSIPPPEPKQIPYLPLRCVYRVGRPEEVSLSFVARRSHALVMTCVVAEQRLKDRLRYERGLSYSVSWLYQVLQRDLAHVIFWVDTLEQNTETVCALVLEVFAELAATGPTEEELEHQVEDTRRRQGDTGYLSYGLEHAVQQALLGEPFETEAEKLRVRTSVTPELARDELDVALATLLLCVPEETRVTDELVDYPLNPPSVVSGTSYRRRGLGVRGEHRSTRLVVGDEGISLVRPDAWPTVRYAECVAALRWADGSRGLWSEDGFYVFFDPIEWRGGRNLAARIDEALPADVMVPMEPEAEAVQERLAGLVGRDRRTSPEFRTLPGHLVPGEEIRSAARAERGWHVGLLVVTDRRLLFLFVDKLVVSAEAEELGYVRVQPATWRGEEAIVVETGGRELVFSHVRPTERLHELAEALTGLISLYSKSSGVRVNA